MVAIPTRMTITSGINLRTERTEVGRAGVMSALTQANGEAAALPEATRVLEDREAKV
jgi:hypothetical protein